MEKNNYTPSAARKDLFKIVKQVNQDRKPIYIIPTKKDEKGAVIVSERDWSSLQETLYLLNTGVLKQIEERENDPVEDFDQAWKEV